MASRSWGPGGNRHSPVGDAGSRTLLHTWDHLGWKRAWSLRIPALEAPENQEPGPGKAGRARVTPQHHASITARVIEISGGSDFLPLASGLWPAPHPPSEPPGHLPLLSLYLTLTDHACPSQPVRSRPSRPREVTLGKSGKLSEPRLPHPSNGCEDPRCGQPLQLWVPRGGGWSQGRLPSTDRADLQDVVCSREKAVYG